MFWVQRLISFAVLLQGFEFLRIPSDEWWNWEILKIEVPVALRPFAKNHRALAAIQVLSALCGLFAPTWPSLLLQLLSTWLLAIRWRGTFNGGSDCMTIQILAASFLSALAPQNLQLRSVCLFYIAAQVGLSYFVGGLAKLCQPSWRSGKALSLFLERKTRYDQLLAWALIFFECLFPVSIYHPIACVLFLSIGIAFHAANFFYFGLNRFLFVWTAAYPALYFAAHNWHHV